ncbi:MAG: hypothetical protein KDC38_05485 [Planctomycetes bacterium]|nr:hypothetical protein [Planctomycetota bacterium]
MLRILLALLIAVISSDALTVRGDEPGSSQGTPRPRAAAEEPEEPGPSLGWILSLWQRLPAPADLSVLFDHAHRSISERIVRTADAVDRFFGEARLDDDARIAQVRVRLDGTWLENEETETRVRVRARVPFPRTQGRLQLAIDSLSEDRVAPGADGDVDTESFAGVRAVFLAGRRGVAFFDIGGRLSGGVEPEIALKAERNGPLGAWRWRGFQSLFWNVADGFGEETRFDLDRTIGSKTFFRTRILGEWSEESRGLEPRVSLRLVRALDPKTALSFNAEMRAYTRPSGIVDSWGLELRLRRQLHRPWFFFEIAPAALFPRERDYEFTPQLTASFEVLFGGDAFRSSLTRDTGVASAASSRRQP